ncbi:MAG: hypothetical protein Q8P32_00770 [Candidatus Komeilibacteria bacterium]|nr:hypothetical protein [Candidatus Komeilibacteria bacterium]
MQIIQLKKFGNILVSRPAGQEAFNAIRPQLDPNTPVQISFDDVLTVTPSWLDEFLTRLTDFNQGKVELLPTDNASVIITLPILAKARQDLVAEVVNRYLDKMGLNN